MIYRVQVNKRVRNIKIYAMLKKTEQRQNAITRLFMRFVAPKRADEESGRG